MRRNFNMADAKVQLKEIYPIRKREEKSMGSGREAYDKMWKRSVEEPDKFWRKWRRAGNLV
jgi:hypothetical protein